MRCWYGHVPHWCHMAFAQQEGLEAEITLLSINGARPTAACGDKPASIEVSAPSSAEALSAVRPSTASVIEPLVCVPVVARVCASSGARAGGTIVVASAGAAKPSSATTVARNNARRAARRTDIVDLLFVGRCEGGHASVVKFDNQDGSFRPVRSAEVSVE